MSQKARSNVIVLAEKTIGKKCNSGYAETAVKISSFASAWLALSLLAVVCVVTIPSHTSARVYSDTSPEFAPGTSWSVPVGFCDAGDIIVWSWSTSGSLGFAVLAFPDMTFHFGFTDFDGFVVDTPGEYNLWWLNDDLYSYATVSYYVLVFTPSLSITTPAHGAYLNSTTVSVQGTYDGYAGGILVGPDQFHMREAVKRGTSWRLDDLALNEGRNTIMVQSYYILDYYGDRRYSLDRTIQVNVDTVLPDLNMLSPVQNSLCPGHVVASWLQSDNSGIVSEEIKFDSMDWQTTTSSEYAIDLPSGTHTMHVRVTDLAGNQNLKAVTFMVDSTMPDLTITSPTEGSYINESAVVSWRISDNYGVRTEEVKIDSHLWETVQSGLPLYLPEGAHTVSVRVTDIAGNQVVKSVNFTKDMNPPFLTVLSPSMESYVSGIVQVSWSCSDNFGVGKREIRVDSSSWQEAEGDEATVEVTDGLHTIEVRATDLAGNTAVKTTHVICDTVPPQVAIDEPGMNEKITQNSVVVSWSGIDDLSGVDHYEVQITGGQWIDVGPATSYEFTDLSDMWHFVTVKAVDRSGNSGSSTIRFGVYTDIWSQDGPYRGIPNYVVTMAIAAGAIIPLFLYWRRRRGGRLLQTQSLPPDMQYYPPRKT